MISDLERLNSYSTKSFLGARHKSRLHIAGYKHELAVVQPLGTTSSAPSDPRQIDPRRQPRPGRACIATRGGMVLFEQPPPDISHRAQPRHRARTHGRGGRHIDEVAEVERTIARRAVSL